MATRAIRKNLTNEVVITDWTDAQLNIVLGIGSWTDVTTDADGNKYTDYKVPIFISGKWKEAGRNYLPIPGSLTIDSNAVNTDFYVNKNLQVAARFACFIIADKNFKIKYNNDNVKIQFFGDQTAQTINKDLVFLPGNYVFHWLQSSKTLKVKHLSEDIGVINNRLAKIETAIENQKTATRTVPSLGFSRDGIMEGYHLTLSESILNFDVVVLTFIDSTKKSYTKIVGATDLNNAQNITGYSDWYDENKYVQSIHRAHGLAATVYTNSNTQLILGKTAGLKLQKITGIKH